MNKLDEIKRAIQHISFKDKNDVPVVDLNPALTIIDLLDPLVQLGEIVVNKFKFENDYARLSLSYLEVDKVWKLIRQIENMPDVIG